jgi:Asp/Glu/hydantoin racemase
MTAADGLPGIVTQEDYERASELVAHYVTCYAQQVQAIVIACFSDPGVEAARATSRRRPVVGLGEAGLRAALAQGQRIGVVAVADAAIPRHLRYWKALGLDSQVVGERAVNLQVAQSGDPELAFGPVSEAGRRLRDQDGADVLLLGCAAMGGLRDRLQAILGIPVVDPCQAAAEAVADALGIGAEP